MSSNSIPFFIRKNKVKIKTLTVFSSLFFSLSFATEAEYDFGTPYVFPQLKIFPVMNTNVNNVVTREGAELGRFLFYDNILSEDYSMACASCHKQQYAFSDGPTRYSIGRFNKPMKRNTPALYNLAWYKAYFWDGRANTIEEQVSHPINEKNELAVNWKKALKRLNKSKSYQEKFYKAFGKRIIDSALVIRAIAQFERTLISHESKYDKVLNGEGSFTQEELEGYELMNDMTKGNCLHCHSTDHDGLGTTGGFSNNGLSRATQLSDYSDQGLGQVSKKNEDIGSFKIPSVRNLLFTAPYMHDGRFNTLEEVMDFYSEGIHNSINRDNRIGSPHIGDMKLTRDEKRKIIMFLKTMTDSIFVSKKEFSNPFSH